MFKSPWFPLLCAAGFLAPITAPCQEKAEKADKSDAAKEESAPKKIKGWGEVTNPAGNCEFESKKDDAELTINLAAGARKARNLCVELNNMDAPRVQRTISGDFELQVKVDGTFQPGEDVLEGSRVPYLGAGINILADDDNYIRMERAVMRYPGPEPRHLINFEIRVNGRLERYGSNEKFPLDENKPVWLRLERKGEEVRGAISHDGQEWFWGEPKKLTAEVWKQESVKAGVHAISTCATGFAPVFSEFLCEDVEKEPAKEGGEERP